MKVLEIYRKAKVDKGVNAYRNIFKKYTRKVSGIEGNERGTEKERPDKYPEKDRC